MCQGNSSEALHLTPRADFGPKSEVYYPRLILRLVNFEAFLLKLILFLN